MHTHDSPHDCSYAALQIIAEGRDQQLIAFESVLDIGRRVVRQWETVVACDRCRTNRQSIIVLRMVADRVLALYDAACVTYGIVHSDGASGYGSATASAITITASGGAGGGAGGSGAANAPGSSQALRSDGHATVSAARQIVCLKSDMVLGQLELEDSDARLLARALLSRRLLRLGTLLEDLKEIVVGLWSENWAQQADTLRACEASISATIDRLVTLVGQLR
jgi:hypothetical protein